MQGNTVPATMFDRQRNNLITSTQKGVSQSQKFIGLTFRYPKLYAYRTFHRQKLCQDFILFTKSKWRSSVPPGPEGPGFHAVIWDEPDEPPHVHVDRDSCSAKFWLKKVSLANNLGFAKKEINELHEIVNKHQKQFLDKWHGYFSTKN